MTVCVAVILSGQIAETVQTLWRELRSSWDVGLSHPGNVPHLTLVTIKGNPRLELLRSGLSTIAETYAPFPVSGAGYGVFAGHGLDSPVLHCALTRTPQLSVLHDAVAHIAAECGASIDGLTQPQFWRPHITLADTGLEPAVTGEIVTYLLQRGPKRWTVKVNNVAMVTPDGSSPCRLLLHGGG
jgi:2'-5' RNA ligase